MLAAELKRDIRFLHQNNGAISRQNTTLQMNQPDQIQLKAWRKVCGFVVQNTVKIATPDDTLKYELVDSVSNEDFWPSLSVMKLHIRESSLGNCRFTTYNVEWFGTKNCTPEIVLEFEA